MKFGIGQPVKRVEDRRFITGRGRYVDDIVLPDQAYAAVLMSSRAHARIRGVDTAAAEAAPGVLCVLTGADVAQAGLGPFPPLFMPEDAGGPKGYRTYRPILCADRVRCVGDRIALVVAETRAQARDAVELIEVDYEDLPAVVAIEDALAPGARPVWDDCPDNVSVRLRFGDPDATDKAFAAAATTVSLTLRNNRLAPNAMEPRCCNGSYDPAAESYMLYTSSQNPHGVRQQVAQQVLRIPETRLRVVSPDVGGGFGVKCDPYPEDALVLWASKVCGRPVSYLATRSESLLADTHGRDQVIVGELAVDETGRILAIRTRASHAVGAYIVSAAMAPVAFGVRFIPSLYDVQVMDISTQAVFTNTAPLGPYRGAGRPEATYVIERLLDRAARALDMDPAEIRRRNLIRPEQMPYETVTHFHYDSGDFPGLLEKCLAEADWDGFAARKAASLAKGRLRGRGMACYIEQGGIFNDRMELRFDPSGGVTIVAGTHSHGQGHATVFSQLVGEWLGMPMDRIGFLQGDTDAAPFGRGTYAARSGMIGGSALRIAADLAIEKATRMATFLLHAEPGSVSYDAGVFAVAGTNKSIPFSEVAKAFYYPGGMPPELGVGLGTVGSWSADAPNFPNGAHACELEIDPETGAVEIDRYVIVDDTGRAMNPMICKGQIAGGTAQGIGQALLESVIYDRETGQLMTGSFSDYAMPRADSIPALNMFFHDVPSQTNPLGVKSVGESGAIASPPTVINAVIDALWDRGVRHIDMPASPARIWQALQDVQTGEPQQQEASCTA